jgi:hypothetical protein
MFQRAVDLDPSFAHAHARLSYFHCQMHFFGFDRTPDRLARAKAADKALELVPDLPEAHRALGKYYAGPRDYAKAIEEYEITRRGYLIGPTSWWIPPPPTGDARIRKPGVVRPGRIARTHPPASQFERGVCIYTCAGTRRRKRPWPRDLPGPGPGDGRDVGHESDPRNRDLPGRASSWKLPWWIKVDIAVGTGLGRNPAAERNYRGLKE